MNSLFYRKASVVLLLALAWTIGVFGQPSNDNCGDAQHLCYNQPVFGTTMNATEECGGPDGDCTSGGFWVGCDNVNNSVWYSFETVPGGGLVNIDLDLINCSDSTQGLTVTLIEAAVPCNASTYSLVACTQGITVDFSMSQSLNPNSFYYLQIASTVDTTVADTAGGCNFSVSVGGPGMQPTIITTLTPPTCPGDNDGSGHTGSNFGSAPYAWAWSHGQVGQNAGGMSAGTYMISITDSLGCVAVDTVQMQDPPPYDIAITTSTTGCGDSTATAEAIASNGEPPYAYAWSTGALVNSISGLPAGGYTVTVVDADGCLQTAAANVVNTGSPSLTFSSTDVTCVGAADGTGTVTATGGSAPYTYAWNDPAMQTTANANNLGIAQYQVTVTGSDGCLAVITVPVSGPEPLELLTNSTPANCAASDGTATAAGLGGTTPYSYNWSSGDTTATAVGLAQGNYNVTITDGNGCTNTAMVTITELPPPASIEVEETPTNCDAQTGELEVDVNGGAFPYTYSLDGSTFQYSNTFRNLAEGGYNITISDANGCTATGSGVVTRPEDPDAVLATENQACNETSGGGVSIAETTAGTGPFSYRVGDETIGGGTFTGIPAGSHVMTITDANNCSTDKGFTIFDACIVPNTFFTPNGDGFHDTWSIQGVDLFPAMEVFVYNRWGQRVFHSNGYGSQWDGKSLGVGLPAATYYYIIYYNGSEKKQDGFIKGSVTIIN